MNAVARREFRGTCWHEGREAIVVGTGACQRCGKWNATATLAFIDLMARPERVIQKVGRITDWELHDLIVEQEGRGCLTETLLGCDCGGDA